MDYGLERYGYRMTIMSYLIALAGLFLLYDNQLIVGGLLFFVGGFFAKKLFISIRSSGVMLLTVSIAFGFHNYYSPIVLFLMLTGFIMACFSTKRTRGDDGWGFDIDFSSTGSGSCDGGGGDCGGD